MSQDFQIAFPCPHFIREEQVNLGSDRRTLLTRQAIGGAAALRILINDSIEVPPVGLLSSATLKGSYNEPFLIPINEQTLTITTQSSAVSVTTPSGHVYAQTLITLLTTAIAAQLGDPLISVSKDTKGRLILKEPNAFGSSSRISVSGSAASHIGFGLQSGATGKQIIPPWGVFSRKVQENTLNVETGYGIIFDSSVQKSNPYFKVDYFVPQNRCLRCQGIGIENVYRFDAQGNSLMVSNENLLYQACVKLLLTRLGSNKFHRWYGTTLLDKIGAKGVGVVANGIKFEITRALDDFKNTQIQQARFQEVTTKERLVSVDSVTVTGNPNDPTTFLAAVVVRNASNEPVVISIVFSVPGAIALAGTNQLTLG